MSKARPKNGVGGGGREGGGEGRVGGEEGGGGGGGHVPCPPRFVPCLEVCLFVGQKCKAQTLVGKAQTLVGKAQTLVGKAQTWWARHKPECLCPLSQ